MISKKYWDHFETFMDINRANNYVLVSKILHAKDETYK